MFIQMQGPLFEEVQTSRVFSDSKTFVDAIPLCDPKLILEQFEVSKSPLKTFIQDKFLLPVLSDNKQLKSKTMKQYIENHWSLFTKTFVDSSKFSTLIPLPFPHVVPGGRFRECYYWDSYFTSLGLKNHKPLVENMVNNFAYLIETYGFIPNGNRHYYLSRSQQPWFSHQLELLKDYGYDIGPYSHHLETEYQYWMRGSEAITEREHLVKMDDGSMLNRYWDMKNNPRPESYYEDYQLNVDDVRHLRAACESGWDFSSRWTQDGKTMSKICTCDIIPIDLNCLLYHMETLLAEFAAKIGDLEKMSYFQNAQDSRALAINKYCYNEDEGFFLDYNYKSQSFTPVLSLAGVMPLFVKLATKSQAAKVADNIEKHFLYDGGLVSTLNESKEQWDFPNGWAPLQWIAIKGLKNYGFDKLANEISQRWLKLNDKVFKETHVMHEKYNVVDMTVASGGEYAPQEGFGWTNGIASKLMES